jgi:hypothetical protein
LRARAVRPPPRRGSLVAMGTGITSRAPTAVPLTAPLPLVLELLSWVAARPRTYGETMEAWRTSCPRMPVWEDATTNGLVAIESSDAGTREHAVCLTPEGRAFLDGHAA